MGTVRARVHSRGEGGLPGSCSSSSSSWKQARKSAGQGPWVELSRAGLADACGLRGPRAEGDWLPKEEVLLSEVVECGLLKGAAWSQGGTTTDARVRNSGTGQKAGQPGICSPSAAQIRKWSRHLGS